MRFFSTSGSNHVNTTKNGGHVVANSTVLAESIDSSQDFLRL